MKALHMTAFVLVVVGALNWGLTALGFNLVESLFGKGQLTMIVYLLVGASAIYIGVTHKNDCKICSKT